MNYQNENYFSSRLLDLDFSGVDPTKWMKKVGSEKEEEEGDERRQRQGGGGGGGSLFYLWGRRNQPMKSTVRRMRRKIRKEAVKISKP